MRYTKNSGYIASLKSSAVVCAAVLVGLCVVRFTPDDCLVKTKNAIKLVLTQNTDIKAEAEKIKNIFVQDNEIAAMNPVAEFVNPVTGGEVAVSFGAQDAEDSGFHYGVDIKVPDGTNILSASSGKVTEIATNEEYGSYIVMEHNEEISTLYAHLGNILPDIGEEVKSGQTIARANTDDNTIHFEIRRGDTYLNPEDFIDFGE